MADMSSVPPKLRADLIIRRQQTPEGVIFVFKDPVTGRFFRFREPEHFIASLLDGIRLPDLVRQCVQEKFGSPLSAETLDKFVASLRLLGLLEKEAQDARQNPAPKPKRVAGSLLYLRFKAFDPDRLLTRLAPLVGFCFTPAFLICSVLVILLAFGVTVSNTDEIQLALWGLWRFDALLLAWLTVLAVTALHEFAHGLTCKHFGGEVREMGFMLIYFQPAFYCNVSDAWLFPDKSQRLWVTFAGAYSEILVWSLATLAWRVVEPGTWVSFLALVVMATSAIKSFFNMNPLIKLDGYYLLSDYLEIPNLRQKSTDYIRAGLRRLFGAAGEPADATPRERRIYVTYGLLAGTYSFWLLGYIALAFGSYLVTRYEGVGLTLYAGLLAVAFQNPLRRLGRRLKPPAPPAGSENAAPSEARKSSAGPWGRRLVGLLVTAALLPLLWYGKSELKVAGAFETLPAHNADVRAEVPGIIEAIYVEEGNFVRKGDPLATLSTRDHRAKLLEVQAEILERQARLQTLAVDPAQRARHEESAQWRVAQVSRLQSYIARLKAEIRFADAELDRHKKLFAEGLVSRGVLEKVEEQAVVKRKEAEAAEAELKMISADDRVELRREFALAQALKAEIARLETQRRRLDEQVRQAAVISPVAGVVTTARPKEKIGQHVNPGDLILEVHGLETLTAEILVPEKEISDVRVGFTVALKARALPEQTFHGTVAAIASEATVDESSPTRSRIVRVQTVLDNRVGILKPGMTGAAKIYCGQRSLFELLSRRLARYLRVEFWSWW